MQPTSELAHKAARQFAQSIPEQSEIRSLHVSLDEGAIILWLEVDSMEWDHQVELALHEIAARINDRYSDIYIELRILHPSASHSSSPSNLLPRGAEPVTPGEVVSDINGTEDTRPY